MHYLNSWSYFVAKSLHADAKAFLKGDKKGKGTGLKRLAGCMIDDSDVATVVDNAKKQVIIS
jgi:hypothetical protein